MRSKVTSDFLIYLKLGPWILGKNKRGDGQRYRHPNNFAEHNSQNLHLVGVEDLAALLLAFILGYQDASREVTLVA